jgi:LysM repeat protein
VKRRASKLAVLALFIAGSIGTVAGAGEKVHEVADGQSLWGIARRYSVSVTDLAAENDLREDASIRPGQKLKIPSKKAAAKAKDERKKNGGSDAKSKADKAEKADKEDGRAKAEPESEAPTRPAAWVTAKPASDTQTQKTASVRGVNPCNTPDQGFGIYDRWSRESSIGQLIMPQRGGITRDGAFDVMIHFHGHEPVRKEWVRTMEGPVHVGIDLGIGSGPYMSAFAGQDSFKRLIESIEKAMAKKTGKKNARVRKVGLSAWSAGYGAVQEIIAKPYGRELVDLVILLDGLHSGYQGGMVNETQIKPFVEWAQLAARGDKLMFVSHSSIIPPGYASTTETANFLIYKVGGKPTRTKPRNNDPMGLDLISRYSRGKFHVRGYSGNDKMDHCAHIGLYRDVLAVHVKPRWNSPRGYGTREQTEKPKVAKPGAAPATKPAAAPASAGQSVVQATFHD